MKLYCDKCADRKLQPTVYASADREQWLCKKHKEREDKKLSTLIDLDD